MLKKASWKSWFFLLLGINICILLYFIISISLPIKDYKIRHEKNALEGYVPFLIHTEKDNLTRVINHYVEKEVSGGPIQYQVVIGDEVELYGTIPIFSEEIEMKMTFEPKGLDNGDLVLHQKSMAIGKMQLPVAYVLKFIADQYRLPKGVTIQPNEKSIYVSMDRLKLKSDFKIRVNEFDLKRDQISFQLYVPIK
ncbi:YpmS family protein [Pseudoneobacillus sp. C159]